MPGKRGWEDYVHNTLLASGHVAKAAIFGTEPVQRWAASPGFEVTTSEAKLLIKSFTDPEKIRAEGISLSETMYTCIKVNGDMILGKSGPAGCVVCKCKQLLLITTYEEGVHPGQCYSLSLKLADYLRNEGF